MASVKFQRELMNLQSNMLNFAYILTSNREEAYELLRDTTLNALVNEEKYEEGTNFKGWVFTIMRNVFNQERSRRAVMETNHSLFTLDLAHTAEEECPEGCWDESEISAVIASLDNEQRAVISMHLTGYRPSEIAEYSGRPLDTVKNCISRACRALRCHFGA